MMRKRRFRFEMPRWIYRWSAGVVCSAGLSISALTAADILVDSTNDSGAGSLRQGLSGSTTGDVLQFQPILNGATLAPGAALPVNSAVTFQDANGITVTDSHAFTLAAPLTVNWNGTLTLNGVISDGTSPGSLVQSGTGTLVLTNANTFSGVSTTIGTSTSVVGTTFNSGTIDISNASALGTGALLVSSVAGTKTLVIGNSVDVANNIILQSGLTVSTAPGVTNHLSGVISGTDTTDTVTTVGAGTLIFSGANTFAGGVQVTNNSTIDVLSNTGLGTGTLSNVGTLMLTLPNAVSLNNSITLGNTLTTNVALGSATLSGNIGESVSSQLIKTGAGTLILTGTNSYTGGTVISQGTLQGNSNSLVGTITDNSALTFNQMGTGAFAGNITGTGTMTQNGYGTLVFSGTSSLTTTTAVDAGVLQVTGSMSSPIFVATTAARLSGTGTVGGVTNSGYVQPGTETVGTLNVNGNYTQTSGGTTEIKVTSPGNAPGVNNDYLNITGQAKLDGSLSILTTGGGTFTPGTQYQILNATSGVTGQFAQAYSNLSMFGVDVTYGTNDVTFQLLQTTSLAAAATTANQFSVGSALDRIALTSSGGLFNMINNLGIQTPAVQRQALNQLNGEMFGNLQTLGLQMGDQFQQRVMSAIVSNGMFLVGQDGGQSNNGGSQSNNADVRGQSQSGGQERGWVQGFGGNGTLQSDGNAGALNYTTGGGVYGVDMANDETGRFGVAGGNSYANYTDSFGGSGTLSSYQIGVYALKQNDVSYLMGSTNYGYNTNITNRAVSVAGQGQTLHADFSGSQIGANAEAGLKIVAGIFHLQPLVGLQYLYLGQQGFEESGGVAGLTVARSRANSLRANVGARLLAGQFAGPLGAVWTPYVHARLVSDVLDNDRIINASFNGAPIGGNFTSQGTRIGQNYGLVGGGGEVRLNETLSIFGGGDLVEGQRITTATGSIALLCRW